MTVLVREELNDADLAWAAADPSLAGVVPQAVRAGATVAADAPADGAGQYCERPVVPSVAFRGFR